MSEVDRVVEPMSMLYQFNRALGVNVRGEGIMRPVDRMALHQSEQDELAAEMLSGNLVGIARELADVVYVAYGTAYDYGIPLDLVLAEVHRANMSKVDRPGGPLLRDDGKVLKPPEFVPPDVAGILQEELCHQESPE